MLDKIEYFSGVLRITNQNTLEKWKKNGKYQKLINEGYIHSIGCGRFRTEICKCCKCRNYEKRISKT